MRLEDRERDPLRGQRLQRRDVDGGLRQPHPLRLAAEAMLEVADAPAHLRPLVAVVGQRQDDVVVGLGDGAAVAGEAVARVRSASRMAAYVSGAPSRSQLRSVGPKLKLIDA